MYAGIMSDTLYLYAKLSTLVARCDMKDSWEKDLLREFIDFNEESVLLNGMMLQGGGDQRVIEMLKDILSLYDGLSGWGEPLMA